MIVIEGADCVGKTTFCHALIDYLRKQDPQFVPVYQHLSKMPPETDGLLVHLSMLGPMQVRDRFHMSEVVYSRALNRPSVMDPATYEVIDARIALMGGMVVILTAADEVIQHRYEKRIADHGKGAEMFPLSTVLDINDRFRAIGHLRVERAELQPGRTVDDDGPAGSRWIRGEYTAHGVPFRVDMVVHQSTTNYAYDFEEGVQRVAKKFIERQCVFMSRFHRRGQLHVDLSKWPL